MYTATLEDVSDMHALGYKYATNLDPAVLDEAATNIALMDKFVDRARLRQGFWVGLQTLRRDTGSLNAIADLLAARVEWFQSEIEKAVKK
jgi:hypothetical protein